MIIQRRKAQNRNSQRAFRERQDRRLKSLQDEVTQLTQKHDKLVRAHSEVLASYNKLKANSDEQMNEKELQSTALSLRHPQAITGTECDRESEKGGSWQFTVKIQVCQDYNQR
jgi:hypothetical protein